MQAYPASPMTCAKFAENVKSLISADTMTLADTGSPELEESTQTNSINTEKLYIHTN